MTPSYEDLRGIAKDLLRLHIGVGHRARLFLDGAMPRRDALAHLLWTFDPQGLGQTRFIDYGAWASYYGGARTSLGLRYKDVEQAREFPYQVIVDLVAEPDTRFPIASISSYSPDPAWATFTSPTLEAFLKEKPATFNGRVVRVSSAQKVESGSGSQVECCIELANYHDQIRTNLGLDFTVYPHGEPATSVRKLDLGPRGELRPLNESRLLNSLGVSAIVGFRKNHEWYFLCRLRRANDAVAEKMLGTVSGVAEVVPGQRPVDLLAFAESEILREFLFETGLNGTHVRRMVPLVFCRELVRGGKPQFMFFIEIDPIDLKQLNAAFRQSAEGVAEFYDSFASRVDTLRRALSYEYAFNLGLALSLLQREDHQPPSPIKVA